VTYFIDLLSLTTMSKQIVKSRLLVELWLTSVYPTSTILCRTHCQSQS